MKKLIFSFIALIVLFCFSPYIGAKFIPDTPLVHSHEALRENGDTPFLAEAEPKTLMHQTIPSMDQCYYFYFVVYASYGKTVFEIEYNRKNQPYIYITIYLTRGTYKDILTSMVIPDDPEKTTEENKNNVNAVLFTTGGVKPLKYDVNKTREENFYSLLPYNEIRVDINTNYSEGACALYYRWELY